MGKINRLEQIIKKTMLAMIDSDILQMEDETIENNAPIALMQVEYKAKVSAYRTVLKEIERIKSDSE